MKTPRLALLLSVTLGISLLRVLPHLPNFTPVVAIALFGGAVFSSPIISLAVVLGSMFISDWIIGFDVTSPVVYGALILITLGAHFAGIRYKFRQVLPVLSLSLAGSTVFFLISNFAVWALQTLYPKSLVGLIACYTAALPFFGNAVVGDLLYTFLLFGILWSAEAFSPRFRVLSRIS